MSASQFNEQMLPVANGKNMDVNTQSAFRNVCAGLRCLTMLIILRKMAISMNQCHARTQKLMLKMIVKIYSMKMKTHSTNAVKIMQIVTYTKSARPLRMMILVSTSVLNLKV